MIAEKNRLVEEIFIEIMNLDASQRESVLIERCRGDSGLENEVRSLLEFHEQGASEEGFLNPSELREQRAALEPVDHVRPQTRVAEFTIVGKLGEGGMGVVYIAQQERPRRTVALKLIRGGIATPSMVRRFEHEAEALGRLTHSGIAQIFEAGVAPLPDGLTGVQPYIAMELVQGPALTDPQLRQNLSLRDRIALIIKVCNAVHHAHQRGVIHRDLKPSNILLTQDEASGTWSPKILDFGVARITQRPTDQHLTTMHTNVGQFVGTLAYMSPEQVHADPNQIDTRTDIYSIGVVLFELLTGTLPIDVRGKSMADAARLIEEQPPVRLRTVDKTYAKDLDVIIAKALEKSRDRRYQSASEIAEDLQRFLDGQPILARQDSLVYVLYKRLQRHRFATALVVLFACCLVGFTAYAAWEAQVQRRLVIREREAREAVNQKAEELNRNLYISAIGFAMAAYGGHDALSMKLALDNCPDNLRGWEWKYLKRLSDGAAKSFTLPDEGAAFAGASQDLGRIAIWTGMSPPRVYDAGSGTQLAILPEIKGISSVLITPDGLNVLVSLASGEIDAYNIQTGERRTIVKNLGPSPFIHGISRDGARMLISVVPQNQSRSARIVHTATGSVLATLPAMQLHCATISPDGLVAATGHSDGAVYITHLEPGDTPTASKPIVVRNHRTLVRAISISDDQSKIASVANDGLLAVFSADGSPIIRTLITDNKLSSVAFNPQGTLVAASGTEPTLHIVDVATTRVITRLIGHETRVDWIWWGLDHLLTIGRDRTVRTWNWPDQSIKDTHSIGEVTLTSAVLKSQNALLCGSQGGFRAYSLTDLSLLYTLPKVNSPPTRLVVSQDESIMAGVLLDYSIVIYDLKGRKILRRIKSNGNRIHGMNISPDGTRIAVTFEAAPHNTIYSVQTGESVGSWPASLAGFGLAWSPDGRYIAVCDITGTITLYDAQSFQSLKTFVGHTAYTANILFTQDMTRMISGDDVGVIMIWNVKTGEPIAKMEGHQRAVYSMALSPDQSRLLTGGWDNTARVWDMEGKQQILRLRGPLTAIYGIDYIPDGTALVTTDGYGDIRLWRATLPTSKTPSQPTQGPASPSSQSPPRAVAR